MADDGAAETTVAAGVAVAEEAATVSGADRVGRARDEEAEDPFEIGAAEMTPDASLDGEDVGGGTRNGVMADRVEPETPRLMAAPPPVAGAGPAILGKVPPRCDGASESSTTRDSVNQSALAAAPVRNAEAVVARS